MSASGFRLKGLRERRAKIRTELEAIGDAMRAGGQNGQSRAMRPEERERFYRLNTEFAELGNQIRAAELELNGPGFEPGRGDVSHVPGRFDDSYGDESDETRHNRKVAFHGWARAQCGMPLTARHNSALSSLGINPAGREFSFPLANVQKRALTVTTSGGGYTIPEDFSGALQIALKMFSGVRGVCDEFTTTTGADLPYPSTDDTSNVGELLAINTEVAYQDPSFSSVTFSAYKFSSKGIVAPSELLQDSAFDLDVVLGRLMGERIARAQGPYFTTGTGTAQPKGIVTCASAGVTTALAAAITPDELTRLAFAVDPAYHGGPRVGYMMHSSIASYLASLKDATGRPLLRESFRDGVLHMTINGFPVFLNQFMEPAVSGVPVTAKKHVLFGDYSRFHVRDAGPVRIVRANERLVEKDQVLFIGFLRSDSNCTDTSSIKYLLQA